MNVKLDALISCGVMWSTTGIEMHLLDIVNILSSVRNSRHQRLSLWLNDEHEMVNGLKNKLIHQLEFFLEFLYSFLFLWCTGTFLKCNEIKCSFFTKVWPRIWETLWVVLALLQHPAHSHWLPRQLAFRLYQACHFFSLFTYISQHSVSANVNFESRV